MRKKRAPVLRALGISMDFAKQIHSAYELVDSDQYADALIQIENLRSNGCNDPVLVLYEALCIYEAGDDLETLRLLSEFLDQAKVHRKREYALFTSAICLMNLGLVSEAKNIFNKIPDSYPNIHTERKNVEEKLKSKNSGISFYKKIVGEMNA